MSWTRWRLPAVEFALSLVHRMVVKTKASVRIRRAAVGQTRRDIRAP